jgi:hypothetical protein
MDYQEPPQDAISRKGYLLKDLRIYLFSKNIQYYTTSISISYYTYTIYDRNYCIFS